MGRHFFIKRKMERKTSSSKGFELLPIQNKNKHSENKYPSVEFWRPEAWRDNWFSLNFNDFWKTEETFELSRIVFNKKRVFRKLKKKELISETNLFCSLENKNFKIFILWKCSEKKKLELFFHSKIFERRNVLNDSEILFLVFTVFYKRVFKNYFIKFHICPCFLLISSNKKSRIPRTTKKYF